MNVLGIIPARGKSKSIKNKNLANLYGKPLIFHTIKAALKSNVINKIVVSSDSNRILKYSSKKNIIAIKRPKNISGDLSPTIKSVQHAIKHLKKNYNYEPEYIIILQPTSPMRNYKDINKAFSLFINKKKADSLVSVQKVPHNFEPFSQMKLNKKGFLVSLFKQSKILTNRKKKQITFARNGAAIYIIKRKNIKKNILNGKIIPYYMPYSRSVDIDDIEDLNIAKKLFKK